MCGLWILFLLNYLLLKQLACNDLNICNHQNGYQKIMLYPHHYSETDAAHLSLDSSFSTVAVQTIFWSSSVTSHFKIILQMHLDIEEIWSVSLLNVIPSLGWTETPKTLRKYVFLIRNALSGLVCLIGWLDFSSFSTTYLKWSSNGKEVDMYNERIFRARVQKMITTFQERLIVGQFKHENMAIVQALHCL